VEIDPDIMAEYEH